MFKRISVFVTVLLISATAIAQNGTVKGFVYDRKTGEPMIYTNVIVKEARTGAQTDNNGYFSIVLPAGTYTIQATLLGFDTATETVTVTNGGILSKKLFIAERGVELKGVEISARKTEQITHINIGKTTITPRDLELLPSAGGEPDVAQYLQVIPGVVFTGDQGGQLYIRGGSTAQTGIYLDGVTIYNPFHSIGLYSVFEEDAIRNVDVYTGGYDAQYGNRTSAIIDVHTKDGNKNNFAGLVSISPIMSRAVLEGPIVKSKSKNGSGITFLLTAKSSYLDQTSKSLYSGLGQPFTNGLNYSFTDLYGKITFSGDNGSKLNIFGFNFTDHAGIDDSNSHTPVTDDYHWQASGVGATFVVSPGSSSALIDGKFAYSKYSINFDPSATSQLLPGYSSINDFEAAINFTYYLPKYSELKYGVEVSGYNTSLSYASSSTVLSTLDRVNTLAGAYVNFRKDFSDKFIFEPSFRIQYYSELSKISLEPRLGLKYNITDNVRIKASGGIYSQNIVTTKNDIDIVNLFTGFTLSPDQQIRNSNGDIVPSTLQTAYHALAGVEVDVDKVELNLEPWYKYFPNIIEFNRYITSPSDPAFMAAEGKAYGIDLSAKYNHDRIYLYGSAGYQKTLYTAIGPDGQPQTYPPPFDARFNMNIVGAYTAGRHKNYDLSLRFNLRSPFPFTQTQGFYENLNLTSNGLNTQYLPQAGTIGLIYANDINDGRLSYYHRLDVSVRRSFEISKATKLDITASVTNVYNRQNIFYVDRVTNVKVYQLPIFPSLNVTFHF